MRALLAAMLCHKGDVEQNLAAQLRLLAGKQQFFEKKVLERFVASVLRERVDFRPNMKLWPIQAILFRLLVAP